MSKSTLQWTDSFLRKYLKESEKFGFGEMGQVNEILKFRASLLDDSAEARLDKLEVQMRNLEADAALSKTQRYPGKR